MTPSKVPMPQAPFVDPSTGYLTRVGNNYLNNLTLNVNGAAAGSVTTALGSGLAGGGVVADGISLIIAPNGVSNAMIRQSAGYSVIGRGAGSTGNVADITATADDRVLARIGGVLAFYDLSLIPATVADGNYGDIAVSGSGAVWTVDNNVVTNAKLAQVATATFKGRTTAGTGNAEDLTATQATALLNAFSSTLKGLVPPSGGGTASYLRADGTWTAAITPTSVTASAQVSAATYLKSTAKTVAALTAAGAAGAGARDCVTDALGPSFGAAVVGGGAVTVPVYSTGAVWNVG